MFSALFRSLIVVLGIFSWSVGALHEAKVRSQAVSSTGFLGLFGENPARSELLTDTRLLDIAADTFVGSRKRLADLPESEVRKVEELLAAFTSSSNPNIRISAVRLLSSVRAHWRNETFISVIKTSEDWTQRGLKRHAWHLSELLSPRPREIAALVAAVESPTVKLEGIERVPVFYLRHLRAGHFPSVTLAERKALLHAYFFTEMQRPELVPDAKQLMAESGWYLEANVQLAEGEDEVAAAVRQALGAFYEEQRKNKWLANLRFERRDLSLRLEAVIEHGAQSPVVAVAGAAVTDQSLGGDPLVERERILSLFLNSQWEVVRLGDERDKVLHNLKGEHAASLLGAINRIDASTPLPLPHLSQLLILAWSENARVQRNAVEKIAELKFPFTKRHVDLLESFYSTWAELRISSAIDKILAVPMPRHIGGRVRSLFIALSLIGEKNTATPARSHLLKFTLSEPMDSEARSRLENMARQILEGDSVTVATSRAIPDFLAKLKKVVCAEHLAQPNT
jgi:hypothetical protein